MINLLGLLLAAKLALAASATDPRFLPAAKSANRAAEVMRSDPAAVEASQAEVIRELQKLLEEPPKGPPPPGQSPKKGEPKGDGQKEAPKPKQNRPTPRPDEKGELLPMPRESDPKTPDATAPKPPTDAVPASAWGMLPERQRRGLMRFARDRWMAGSEELLRDYYSGLASPKPPGRGTP